MGQGSKLVKELQLQLQLQVPSRHQSSRSYLSGHDAICHFEIETLTLLLCTCADETSFESDHILVAD